MWVCMSDAFVSVVQDKSNPNQLAVRARRPEHLERLFPKRGIVVTRDADYFFRVFVSRDELIEAVAHRISTIDYPNFKATGPDWPVHDLMTDLWRLDWEFQHEG